MQLDVHIIRETDQNKTLLRKSIN